MPSPWTNMEDAQDDPRWGEYENRWTSVMEQAANLQEWLNGVYNDGPPTPMNMEIIRNCAAGLLSEICLAEAVFNWTRDREAWERWNSKTRTHGRYLIRTPKVQYIPTEAITNELIRFTGPLDCEVTRAGDDRNPWHEEVVNLIHWNPDGSPIYVVSLDAGFDYPMCRITHAAIKEAFANLSEARQQAMLADPEIHEAVKEVCK